MYISPFWCGVGTTLLIEIVLIGIYVIYVTREGDKSGKDKHNKSNK